MKVDDDTPLLAITSIKQLATDMETVADFLGMKGRFESDMVVISIKDLADAVRRNDA
jgi:hypothetical protein